MTDLPAFASEPLISATYAGHLLDVLEARGLVREQVLAQCGIAPAVLAEDGARLAPLQFLRLLDVAEAAGQAEGLGFAFGMALKPTSHGFLGMALMACPTARDALQMAERFAGLRAGFVHLRYREEGDTGVVQFDHLELLGPYRFLVLETLACIFVRTAAFLLGRNSDSTEIWMSHPEPDYFVHWRAQLPTVRFGMPANQVRFPVAVLDRPLALASPAVARAAAGQLESELAVVGAAESVTARVRARLERVRGEFPVLEEVAGALCMSASTLKRRLQQEGSTFQGLLDEVRCAQALRYLGHTPMSVEQVAQALGYADPANFSRAFRKWTGKSPSSWRSGQRARSGVMSG